MTLPTTERLPKAVLLDLLPATFEPWGSSGWYSSRPPTPESVDRIESSLGIAIPRLFVEVASFCPSYGGWFNSLGDDYQSHFHLLSNNAALREAGLAARYVLLNHGHDGDCDAWDREGQRQEGELPIMYFNYNEDDRILRGMKLSATCFADYIENLVRVKAPRCPVKSLRRHAKKVLTAHDGSAPA